VEWQGRADDKPGVMVVVFVLLVVSALGAVLLTVARVCRERQLRALWLEGGQVMGTADTASESLGVIRRPPEAWWAENACRKDRTHETNETNPLASRPGERIPFFSGTYVP
jgi:hypothetical protein